MLDLIIIGFQNALSLTNLAFIAAGIALGIVIGAIPGLGSVTALAVLIPITFYMSPLTAIAFLVGVNKGGTSGGAIPAILMDSPGTPEAAATALDGHPLAKKGQAMRALKFALYSSVAGDSISDVLLIILVVPFAAIALQFGPLEMLSVIAFSFVMLAGITGSEPLKGLLAISIGVFLSTIGLDPVNGEARLTFDNVNLFDGLTLLAFGIGSLAMASIAAQILDIFWGHEEPKTSPTKSLTGSEGNLCFKEFIGHWKTIVRSALIGSGVGMLPGLGVSMAALLGYGAAKRASKNPENFGTGNPDGIVATEAANSAVVGSNLIPTIALGIPGNIAAALLIGAFMIHGVVPGPFMLKMHGELIYGLFASMILANGVHLLVGRIGIPFWVKFAYLPRYYVLPPVLVLCMMGVYLPSQSFFDIGVMFVFAVIGLVMRRLRFPVVCLVIGYLLGGMLETSLRQTLLLHAGDMTAILHSPIALGFSLLTVFVVVRSTVRSMKKKSQ